jgi:hypothetical protein
MVTKSYKFSKWSSNSIIHICSVVMIINDIYIIFGKLSVLGNKLPLTVCQPQTHISVNMANSILPTLMSPRKLYGDPLIDSLYVRTSPSPVLSLSVFKIARAVNPAFVTNCTEEPNVVT